MINKILKELLETLKNSNLEDYFMYDALFITIFTKQPSLKYKHRRNYRKTIFIYVPFMRPFNWAFWRKHSAYGPHYQTDLVGYSNNKNIIRVTQCITSLKSIVLHQFFNLRYNRHISIISTEDSKNYSTSRL